MTLVKSALTREAILDAARVVFARQGYRGTSVTDIAEGLHVTRANFYYYYRDKKQLFIELGTETYKESFAAIDAFDDLNNPPELGDIRRWVDLYFTYLDRNGALVARSFEDSPEDEAFRANVTRVHRKSARRLGEYIRARSSADFSSSVALGMSMMAMLERSWLLANTDTVASSPDSAARSAAEVLAQLMR